MKEKTIEDKIRLLTPKLSFIYLNKILDRVEKKNSTLCTNETKEAINSIIKKNTKALISQTEEEYIEIANGLNKIIGKYDFSDEISKIEKIHHNTKIKLPDKAIILIENSFNKLIKKGFFYQVESNIKKISTLDKKLNIKINPKDVQKGYTENAKKGNFNIIEKGVKFTNIQPKIADNIIQEGYISLFERTDVGNYKNILSEIKKGIEITRVKIENQKILSENFIKYLKKNEHLGDKLDGLEEFRKICISDKQTNNKIRRLIQRAYNKEINENYNIDTYTLEHFRKGINLKIRPNLYPKTKENIQKFYTSKIRYSEPTLRDLEEIMNWILVTKVAPKEYELYERFQNDLFKENSKKSFNKLKKLVKICLEGKTSFNQVMEKKYELFYETNHFCRNPYYYNSLINWIKITQIKPEKPKEILPKLIKDNNQNWYEELIKLIPEIKDVGTNILKKHYNYLNNEGLYENNNIYHIRNWIEKTNIYPDNKEILEELTKIYQKDENIEKILKINKLITK